MTFPDVQDKVMRFVVHLPRSILQHDKEANVVESQDQEQQMQEAERGHSQQSLVQQELDEERLESEHLRLEQHREHQLHSEVYQRIHAQWVQAIQPVLILPPPFEFPEAAMHQAMLESMMLSQEIESESSHNAVLLSHPRALTKMSQVCYCIHRLTRIELFETSIHEEYRTLVHWMHRTMEETETIRQLVHAKVHALQEQRIQSQQEHQAKLEQLQQKHLEQKIALLKIRLEERKRWVGKPTTVHSTSPDGTVKTVATNASDISATTTPMTTGMELLLLGSGGGGGGGGGGSDTTDSESMHSVDLDLGEWDDDDNDDDNNGGVSQKRGNGAAPIPPFLRQLLPIQLFGTAKR